MRRAAGFRGVLGTRPPQLAAHVTRGSSENSRALPNGPRRARAIRRQRGHQGRNHDLDTQRDGERDAQAALVQTEDFIEAVKAFKDKRKPVFQGR